MSIPREAYETLQSIVGKDWVSDDPAVCEADRFCSAGGAPAQAIRPGCSIQPASTEEVQSIVKVANMYKLPYVATSTFYSGSTYAKKESTILIDLKRMNKLEIDHENLYAVVEPGVAFQPSRVISSRWAFSPLSRDAGGTPQCWLIPLIWVMPPLDGGTAWGISGYWRPSGCCQMVRS